MEENIKSKTSSRMKERRQAYNQDGLPKKINKNQGSVKTDLSQLPPPHPFDEGSPVKKLFTEATKIVKIGMEKDYALHEKDNTLQNSNETIENLRKNILHLQMEYEKLDQNFQREISYRSEIVKRMDATRELIESVVQCSNVLASSIKQLEDDRLKIVEFYELIYENQKEVETKHAHTEKFLKEQDELLKAKMGEVKKFQDTILSQHSDTVSQLNIKLTHTSDKLKISTDENEKLQTKIQGLQESSSKLEVFLEQQVKLNFLHQENIFEFKYSLKKLKIQRFKYQKLLKNAKKKLLAAFSKNKILRRSLKKAEMSYGDCLSINKALESKKDEWKSRFENHLEEAARERQSWETQRQDLINKMTGKEGEIADLKMETENLNRKIRELTVNEGTKRMELEQVQCDLSKMMSENLQLKEDVTKLNEENKDKAKMISELKIKTSTVDCDLSTQLEFYKSEFEKSQEVVKTLESQLCELQKSLAYEMAQKDNLILDFNTKFEESMKISNQKISNLEKLLEEKTENIRILEALKSQSAMDVQTSFEKLKNELRVEKLKTKELNKDLENAKETCGDVNKKLEEARKQISNYEAKLTEVNSKNETLNHTQNELEKNVSILKKEIEFEKKAFRALEEKYKKAEKELAKMPELIEENATLKTSATDFKKLLEATEARLEAYKIVVKKLESERIETKNSHSEEVAKLKLELTRAEERMKKDKHQLGILQMTAENPQNKKEGEASNTRTKETQIESLSSPKLNTKENEPEMGSLENWQQSTTSPLQSGKKFLLTPRKTNTSTPKLGFRNLTPMKKKRDPYEFDSDSSVERFDQNKVLKVFNRQKKEATKRSKTTK